MIIYKVTNKVNQKVYIGQTTRSFELRWKEHVSESYRCPRETARFGAAIRKYGVEAFSTEVLYEARSQNELNKMETFFIALHQSTNPEYGYNMGSGGDTPHNSGKKMEEEYGEDVAKEMKDNLALHQRKHHLGTKHTEETKQKMSDSAKKRDKTPYQRPSKETIKKRRQAALAYFEKRRQDPNNPIKIRLAERMKLLAAEQKGKTYEQRFGLERAILILEKKSHSHKMPAMTITSLKQTGSKSDEFTGRLGG